MFAPRKDFAAKRCLLLLPVIVFGAWATISTMMAHGAPIDYAAPDTQLSAAAVGPYVSPEIKHDLSPALRSLTVSAKNPQRSGYPGLHVPKDAVSGIRAFDPLAHAQAGPYAMPTPLFTFEGLYNTNQVLPPDPSADVSLNYYFQSVNNSFQVWNKSGSPVYGPAPNSTVWQGFGGPCESLTGSALDVLYDSIAHRWFLSTSVYPNFPSGPSYQCIAVSTSEDPTGQWHRYAFILSPTKVTDLTRLGVWPDGYYMAANLFTSSLARAGDGQYVFDRTRMLDGQSATMQYFEQPPTDWGGMLPTDFDGATQPPTGSPNYFINVIDDAWNPPFTQDDELLLWRFHVDWATPSNTTFTGPLHLPVEPFDGIVCCIPQPSTSTTLNPGPGALMPRLAYHNFSDHEALVLNHTVQPDSSRSGYTGVRWYELRDLQGSPGIFQQGTYAPDLASRWLGSIAMDRDGNIAAGFSISDGSIFPSIRYAGRLVSDPPGEFAQGEATLWAGAGSQTAGGAWGASSALSIDPADDCTFWYTNEYYPMTTPRVWHTRIGAFKFPDCGAGTATPATTSTVTPAATSTVTPSATGTPTTHTHTPTRTPFPTCTAIPTFTDVSPNDWFHEYVLCLACHGVISGYNDGTFRPYNNVTRGQTSKIVVLALAWPLDCSGGPQFSDVPPSDPFYCYIETAYAHGIIAGYADGTFRPHNSITRGQVCKMVVLAMAWPLIDPPTPTFSDVPRGSPFYTYIETAYCHQIITGYADGTFRPGNPVTRAQLSKIVCLAIRNEHDCNATPTPAAISLNKSRAWVAWRSP
jgi:hypothetical protein